VRPQWAEYTGDQKFVEKFDLKSSSETSTLKWILGRYVAKVASGLKWLKIVFNGEVSS